MKPKSWEQCPGVILESVLWDCDLEYDPYEGSKAETIHAIQCGVVNSDNGKIIEEYWENMSEEEFVLRCKNEIQCLENQLKGLKDLFDKV
jgi:hypothetical protein